MKTIFRFQCLNPIAGLAVAVLLTGCGMELEKDEPGQPGSNPNPVHLERHTQRVLRYSCQGALLSDRIEAVKKANQWVKVRPSGSEKLASSSFKNRQSGDTPDLIVGYTEFKIKYSNGDLGMKVQPGLNVIDYRFYGCKDWVSAETCRAGQTFLFEEGTSSLDITYEEKFLPGTLEIREPCPSPSPSSA